MLLAKLRDRLFAIDGRSLAAFRVCIGALVVVDLLTRATALEQHYSDRGVLPREAFARLFALSDWHWSIHLWTGSVAGQAALFSIAAVAACALVVGYRTRLATVVTWLLLVSLQARNPMVLYGADQLLRLLLFWSMFLPLGATWSIDRLRGVTLLGRPERHLSMASAALLLQPCVMYFFAGLLKLNPAWHSGNAIFHALSADMYAKPLGRQLLSYPAVLESLSHVVPWLEMLAPVVLFVPWATAVFRVAGLLLLGAFHLGIASVLVTGLFQMVALAGLLPFIPSQVWDRLPVAARVRHALRSLGDRLTSLFGRPAPPERSSRGPWIAGAQQGLVAALLVYVLAWNVTGLGVEEYSLRHMLPWAREWWAAGRAGVPLSFRDYAVERMMGEIGPIGRIAHLHQRWDMFYRVSAEIRGWPLVVGTARDGRQVSMLEGGRPFEGATHPQPDAPLAFYPGTRWRVYFGYLRTSGVRPARELLPAVVTRDWHRRHPELEIEALKMFFVQGPTSVDGEQPARRETWYEDPGT